ncbi:MAG: glycosyl hydrolase family 16, partial [Candidatus Paceibacterota bacterium]
NGFGTDNDVAYEGSTSIRIDVPAPNDPDGGYIGGIFRDRGNGRNLTGYDALTFWVKASTTATIGTVGFGVDFGENKYSVLAENIQLSTDWRKIVIPIPDPSKLTQERGMFLFSAGTEDTNGVGYTFWIDELRFEKLGNNSLLYPFILNGQDLIVDGFLGAEQNINNLGAVFNLSNGQNFSVTAATGYFNFTSSDPSVATVNELGIVNIVGDTGTTVITASLNNDIAQGSLTINAAGTFENAPNPTLDPANVLSIYSDTYNTIAGFNPGIFAGPNTGNISAPTNAGNQHINYQSIDFIGMGWNGTVNASSKTMIHLHVKLIGSASTNLRVELKDFGPNGVDDGPVILPGFDDTAGGHNISNLLIQDQWVSINIPLNQFTLPTGGGGAGNPNRSNLGFIVLVSSNGASVLVDNIYFY